VYFGVRGRIAFDLVSLMDRAGDRQKGKVLASDHMLYLVCVYMSAADPGLELRPAARIFYLRPFLAALRTRRNFALLSDLPFMIERLAPQTLPPNAGIFNAPSLYLTAVGRRRD
jgi:hypothetical protein